MIKILHKVFQINAMSSVVATVSTCKLPDEEKRKGKKQFLYTYIFINQSSALSTLFEIMRFYCHVKMADYQGYHNNKIM